MMDYIDSQCANPNSEYYGFNLGQVVFGKDYNAKLQSQEIYAKYNPQNQAEKIESILKAIPEQSNRYEVLSRCFGINDLKEFYFENRERVHPKTLDNIHVTTRYDSFLFYVTMTSNMDIIAV